MFRVLQLLLLIVPCADAQQWQYVGLAGERITAIAFDHTDASKIFAGSGSNFSLGTVGGVFRTNDGGATWDTLMRGVTVVDLDVHPHDSRILYATLGANGLTEAGIRKTTNGGENWTPADSGIWIVPLDTGPKRLAINPHFPETLYAGTGGPGGGSFYKSLNGGRVWTDLAPPPHWLNNGIESISVNPNNPSTLYVGTVRIGFLVKTTDGGNNWFQTGFVPNGIVNSIALLASFPETLFATATSFRRWRFERSFDGGLTWLSIDVPSVLERTVVASRMFLYLEGYDTLGMSPRGHALRSSDLGVTWVDLGWPGTDAAPVLITVDTSNSTLYVGKQDDVGGLYRRSVSTSVETTEDPSSRFWLHQNYPNPFNSTTLIKYEIDAPNFVSLKVFDVLGQHVKTLVNQRQAQGLHVVHWDGTDGNLKYLSSGLFFCQLTTHGRSTTKKMLLTK